MSEGLAKQVEMLLHMKVATNQEFQIQKDMITQLKQNNETLLQENKKLREKLDEVLALNETLRKEMQKTKELNLIGDALTELQKKVVKQLHERNWRSLAAKLEPTTWTREYIEEMLTSKDPEKDEEKKIYHDALKVKKIVLSVVAKEWGFTEEEWDYLNTLKRKRNSDTHTSTIEISTQLERLTSTNVPEILVQKLKKAFS